MSCTVYCFVPSHCLADFVELPIFAPAHGVAVAVAPAVDASAVAVPVAAVVAVAADAGLLPLLLLFWFLFLGLAFFAHLLLFLLHFASSSSLVPTPLL